MSGTSPALVAAREADAAAASAVKAHQAAGELEDAQRKSELQRHIDFHLQLRAETKLGEAHKISDALEERIRRNLPNSDVLIHLEDDRSLKDEDRDRQRPGIPR